MRGNWIWRALALLLLATGVSACASGVQPGIVSSTPPPQTASAGPQPAAGPYYGQGQAPPPGYSPNGNGGPGGYYGQGPQGAGMMPVSASAGDGGRVVAINDVSLQGSGGLNGTTIGGILGGLGGIAIGVATGGGWAGGLLGGLLGGMGGAAAGTMIQQGGGGRGIEVVVQRDDGSTVTVAQRDDGDIQLGDRVQIVQGRNGAARAMRDTSRTYDNPPQQNGPPQQYSPPPQQYGPPQGGYSGGYRAQGDPRSQYGPQYSGQYRGYGPPPGYSPPQASDHTDYVPQSQYNQSGDYYQPRGPVYPQNDPRYGSLQ